MKAKGHTVGETYWFGPPTQTKQAIQEWTADRILCKIKGRNRTFDLNIILHLEFMDFVIFDYIKGLESFSDKGEVFNLLLKYNTYLDNLGSFGYDDLRGCIVFRVTYPYFKGNITFPQFWQCLTNFFTIADKLYPEILSKLKETDEGGNKETNEDENE